MVSGAAAIVSGPSAGKEVLDSLKKSATPLQFPIIHFCGTLDPEHPHLRFGILTGKLPKHSQLILHLLGIATHKRNPITNQMYVPVILVSCNSLLAGSHRRIQLLEREFADRKIVVVPVVAGVELHGKTAVLDSFLPVSFRHRNIREKKMCLRVARIGFRPEFLLRCGFLQILQIAKMSGRDLEIFAAANSLAKGICLLYTLNPDRPLSFYIRRSVRHPHIGGGEVWV